MNIDVQGTAIFLTVLLLSMSIHEMMHAFVSDALGDDTARHMGRVSLNPIKHIDPIYTVALPLLLYLSHSPFLFGAAKPVQVNFNRLKWGEFGGAIVGMAGPVTNFVIAAIAALAFNHMSVIPGSGLYTFFQITIVLNVGLFVFNSIPWPPLDGSRLLYAFAPQPLQEFMQSIERMGMVALILFIFIIYSLGAPIGTVMQNLVHFMAPTLVT